MIKFYNCDEFEQWYQDFLQDTGYNIDKNQINILNIWKDLSVPLSQFFPLYEYSSSGECYVLNNQVIVKTSTWGSVGFLYQKYLKYPILKKYIIPTYVYTLKKQHIFDSKHIQRIIEKHGDQKLKSQYSDCLILQPKCKIPKPKPSDSEIENFLKQDTELFALKDILDITNVRNFGLYNNEMKFFDW